MGYHGTMGNQNFGSNVDGETESVRVPKDLEAWFGSHESGLTDIWVMIFRGNR